MATELYAILAPNVIMHNADIMTNWLDFPASKAFLAVDPSAEFYIIDYPWAMDLEMMPYSEATLLPLTEAKFLMIEPVMLCFYFAVYAV